MLDAANPSVWTLPPAGRLAWWGTAWMRGHIGPDDLLDVVRGDDVSHLVVGGDSPHLLPRLAAAREAGATGVGLALPVAGDLVGLGGPAPFNRAALQAGEAAVTSGLSVTHAPERAWTPLRVGPTVEWSEHEAARRPVPDVGEASRALRSALISSASELERLDVARWQPDLADDLLDLRTTPQLDAPPGVPEVCVDVAARALWACQMAARGLSDDGGAISASEAAARRAALLPLERAGRHGLVAACSPEAWPPERPPTDRG